MTRNLSPGREKLGEPIPKSCPKCGATTLGPADFRSHVRTVHPGALAIATSREFFDADPREFVYVSPAYGRSDAWTVVWLDWPFEATTLDRKRFIVEWVHPVGPGKERA